MALGRYTFVNKVRGGLYYGSAQTSTKVFNAVNSGDIDHVTITLSEAQRLDHIAGQVYNDSRLWWIIAAASGIGWGLQVPPGKIIKIPTNIENVLSIL